jgi:uncharacterized protein YyaL (SSP411 family)
VDLGCFGRLVLVLSVTDVTITVFCAQMKKWSGVEMRFFFAVLLSTSVFVSPLSADQSANQLAGHGSPYLAMHGNDPVAWQDWSAEVLAQAKKQNKLLFVSIGYFSCHWCHVMQRESFSDRQVADILNADFISVKVDRELNPALDSYLLDFVARTRGSAGWPLNVFLTPDGHPLVGMVYLPKDRFVSLLNDLQQQWQQAPLYLMQAAAKAAAEMKGEPVKADPPLKPGEAQRYQTILVQQALQLGDEMDGGFGEQTKFPMVPQLDALLSAYQRHPLPQLKTFLMLTLERMATQGMRDHLAGGFFRYTTDPDWQTPHFEKMLYDNALLSSLYLRAATILEYPKYELVARDTLDFMLDNMRGKQGAMIASFSAIDDKGVEGGYYLWETETLQANLSPTEYALVKTIWGLEGQSSFEAGYLPRVHMSLQEAADKLQLNKMQAQQYFQSALQKLLAERSRRVLPADEKHLTAWNGLALNTFVQAARLADGEKYRQAAQGVRDYLVNSLWQDNRLYRAKNQGKGKNGELGQAGLEDYAFAAQGLLAWAELTTNENDFQLAARWVKDAWRRFHDDTGWLLSDQTLLPSGFGVPLLDEGPLPSPAAVLLQLSENIARHNQDKMLSARVKQALTAGHTQLQQVAFDYPSQVRLLADSQLSRQSNHD